MGTGGCSLREIFQNLPFLGKKRVIFGQNHLIFELALEEIFGQEHDLSLLNGTGPVARSTPMERI